MSEPLDYLALQETRDRQYLEAWRAMMVNLSYGDRAALRAMKLHKPELESVEASAVGWEEDMAERMVDEETPYSQINEEEIQMGFGMNSAEMEERLKEIEDRRRADLHNHHFHCFAMFMGTGVECFELLKMRSLIMLKHAAPGELARFGLLNGSVLEEINRLKKWLSRGGPYDYLPLSSALTSEAEDEEIQAAEALHLDVRALRLLRFGEFCEEIANRSASIDHFVKNLAAWLRRAKPDEIAGLGRSQTDFSRKFGEKRATTCAREKRVVEEPVKAAGFRGYHLTGGTKSDAHRRNCAKAQLGNSNRRTGEARKRGA